MTTIRASKTTTTSGNKGQSGKQRTPAPHKFKLDIEEWTEGMSAEEMADVALELDKAARTVIRKRAGLLVPEVLPTPRQMLNELDNAFGPVMGRAVTALFMYANHGQDVNGHEEGTSNKAAGDGLGFIANDAIAGLMDFGRKLEQFTARA